MQVRIVKCVSTVFSSIYSPVELLSILVPLDGVERLPPHVVVAPEPGPAVHRLVAWYVHV